MYNFWWILTWVYYYFGGIFGLILFWCREILSVNYYPDFGVAGFWDTTIKLNLVLFWCCRFLSAILIFENFGGELLGEAVLTRCIKKI